MFMYDNHCNLCVEDRDSIHDIRVGICLRKEFLVSILCLISLLKVGLYLLITSEGMYLLFACEMVVLKCCTAASMLV